jgi:hypothetical protein
MPACIKSYERSRNEGRRGSEPGLMRVLILNLLADTDFGLLTPSHELPVQNPQFWADPLSGPETLRPVGGI